MTNILIFSESVDAQGMTDACRAAYPDDLHEGIASALDPKVFNIRKAFVDDLTVSITPEILKDTDVLIWWGHCQHHLVPDETAKLVMEHVQMGMGFIALHSAHFAKPFTRLLGTSGTLSWRNDDRERIWTAAPYHPIAAGIPTSFELENEEMYGEPFDIPQPEEVVFIGWFAGGEVFRSGVTFRRGYGKIFYFQPGHETFPIYYNPIIQRILLNAVNWAKPNIRREQLACPNLQPLENQA